MRRFTAALHPTHELLAGALLCKPPLDARGSRGLSPARPLTESCPHGLPGSSKSGGEPPHSKSRREQTHRADPANRSKQTHRAAQPTVQNKPTEPDGPIVQNKPTKPTRPNVQNEPTRPTRESCGTNPPSPSGRPCKTNPSDQPARRSKQTHRWARVRNEPIGGSMLFQDRPGHPSAAADSAMPITTCRCVTYSINTLLVPVSRPPVFRAAGTVRAVLRFSRANPGASRRGPPAGNPLVSTCPRPCPLRRRRASSSRGSR